MFTRSLGVRVKLTGLARYSYFKEQLLFLSRPVSEHEHVIIVEAGSSVKCFLSLHHFLFNHMKRQTQSPSREPSGRPLHLPVVVSHVLWKDPNEPPLPRLEKPWPVQCDHVLYITDGFPVKSKTTLFDQTPCFPVGAGQAGRIDGVRAGDLAVLTVYLKKLSAAREGESSDQGSADPGKGWS